MADQKGIRLCALWLNESKQGTRYFKGRLGNAVLMGWLQTNKKNEKQPDLVLMVYPEPEKSEEERKPKRKTKDDDTNDEMPF